MSHNKLILTPAMGLEPPSTAQLLGLLAAIGLIEPAQTPTRELHLPGERFLQLITFLGCSPYVRLRPESAEDDGFCHIRIGGPYQQPLFRRGRNTVAPRCPACRERLGDALAALDRGEEQLGCSACRGRFSAPQLDWRQSAGAGRLFVEIWGVFPGEAVPSAELLKSLEGLGCGWNSFYLQE